MVRSLLTGTLAASVLLTACGGAPTTPAADSPTQLMSVIPTGGSTNVNPNAPIVVEFSHAMMADMTGYMVLHEGAVTGPVVAGTWAWNAERTRATFTPAAPLKARTAYTIHMGGAMMDAEGRHVGFQQHGSHMGGQTATGGMMGGGMMGGGMMGGGMMADSSMMGPGWRHADGSYGMVFTFTTA
jgi:hypothetical protein